MIPSYFYNHNSAGCRDKRNVIKPTKFEFNTMIGSVACSQCNHFIYKGAIAGREYIKCNVINLATNKSINELQNLFNHTKAEAIKDNIDKKDLDVNMFYIKGRAVRRYPFVNIFDLTNKEFKWHPMEWHGQGIRDQINQVENNLWNEHRKTMNINQTIKDIFNIKQYPLTPTETNMKPFLIKGTRALQQAVITELNKDYKFSDGSRDALCPNKTNSDFTSVQPVEFILSNYNIFNLPNDYNAAIEYAKKYFAYHEKPKHNFKVDNYIVPIANGGNDTDHECYKQTYSCKNNQLLRINNITKSTLSESIKEVQESVICDNGYVLYINPSNPYFRLATDNEIFNYLSKTAFEKGFKPDSTNLYFDLPNNIPCCITTNLVSFEYDDIEDKLYCNGDLIYQKGKWSKIIHLQSIVKYNNYTYKCYKGYVHCSNVDNTYDPCIISINDFIKLKLPSHLDIEQAYSLYKMIK